MKQVDIIDDVNYNLDAEGTKDDNEGEIDVVRDTYCFFEKESVINLYVFDLKPLPYTQGAVDDHTYF